ncbi:MAG: fatty acid desaturase [Proteobacteria bacterium]|nr:fatty acid desaturase [Pseudomonadota bacterium]
MATMADGVKKVTLPKEFYKISLWGTAGFIAYCYSLLVFSLVMIWQVYQAPWPTAYQVALIIPLSLVAGQGIHLLGWVGHEGFHFNLSRNRHISAFLAVLCTGPVAFFSTVGEHSLHRHHHMYTNTERDEYVHLFPKYKSVLSRILIGRPAVEMVYLLNTCKIALGKFDLKMGFNLRTMTHYARLDLLWSGAWMAAYIWLFVHNPVAGALLVALPHASGFLVAALRPYAEHAGTTSEAFQSARSRTSWLVTLVYFFNNYHLEHHLYQQVPCYNLPKVHRYLKDRGLFHRADSKITPTVSGAFHAGTRLQYPTGRSDL